MGIKNKKQSKNNKKIFIIIISALIFLILASLIIQIVLIKSSEEPATRDYGYTKNLNVDGIALSNFHDGMAKIANSEGKIGFIDKRGDIAIYPQFYCPRL